VLRNMLQLDLVEWLGEAFTQNSLDRWMIAMITAAVVFIVLLVVRRLVVRRFRRLAERTHTFIDDAVVVAAEATKLPVMLIVSLEAGLVILQLPEILKAWASTITTIALLIQVGIWGSTIIDRWMVYYRERNLTENADRIGTARVMSFVARIVLYSIVVLLTLDNLPGVEVTPLIASLGITGIAVALAVQSILSDLFASLTIALDKPFVIGDFIIIGDYMGSVDQIGLKTTRVRSLSGEQIIFPNSDLINSRIRNYKRMEDRRIVFSVGVLYETPAEKLRAIPQMIREIIEQQENARFDRAHFKSFGAFSLDFEVVYYVLSPDYNLYMDLQHAINLAIFERFAAEGIGFAYPTQTLYLSRTQNGEAGADYQAQGSRQFGRAE
jgi:small-conductance mechanosensitive channel